MFPIEILMRLFSCMDETVWIDSLYCMLRTIGIEYVLFFVAPTKLLDLENVFVKSNYPQQWQTIYEDGQLHSIDPVLNHCRSSNIPIIWHPEIFVTSAQQRLYQDASLHGLKFGISLPIHGARGEFGVLSCASSCNKVGMRLLGNANFLSHLALIRDYAFESSRRFFKKTLTVDKPVKLTARERDCMTWMIAGKSSWEISKILNCAEVTVNFHVGNIKEKFKVRTRQHAIARAILTGALEVV